MSSYDYGVEVNIHYDEKSIDAIMVQMYKLCKIYLNNNYNKERVMRVAAVVSETQEITWTRLENSDFEDMDVTRLKELISYIGEFWGASFSLRIPATVQSRNLKKLGKIGVYLQISKKRLCLSIHPDDGKFVGKEAEMQWNIDLRTDEDLKKNQEMWLTTVLSIMRIVEPLVVNCTIDPAIVIEKLRKNAKDEIIDNNFLPDLGEEYNWFVYLKEDIKVPEFTFEKFLEPFDFLQGKLYINPIYILADVEKIIEKVNRKDFDFCSEMKAFDEAIGKSI